MNEKPYRVHVIVDPRFGQRLLEMPENEPIWIADTETNHLAYKAAGKERIPKSHLVGLSSFKVDPYLSPADWLISILETIDLHHGEMSHNPSWSVINVIGIRWTQKVQEELRKFGFEKYEDSPEGFTARKRSVNEPD
ncbi:MAG: hypothetical protein EHM45_08655 [Desulfobacteraceae bacterium]|nr:MAG: hypothetical protein EHM45_08655 [Desulfobacteraceae bacterium]